MNLNQFYLGKRTQEIERPNLIENHFCCFENYWKKKLLKETHTNINTNMNTKIKTKIGK